MTTYWIAWHPEYGGNKYTQNGIVTFEYYASKEMLMKRMGYAGEKELPKPWLIKPVHLVESDKVREMWEKIKLWQSHVTQRGGAAGYYDCLNATIELLHSILPEPTEAKEEV
jgi:hypothetical protein